MLDTLVYGILGLLIGALSTLAGIGGGVFMVPLFYFMGLSIEQAVGTSKFVVVFTSLIGAVNYARSRKVLYGIGWIVLAGMIPFSMLGAYLSTSINSTALKLIVSIFIIFYGTKLLASYVTVRIKGGSGARENPSGEKVLRVNKLVVLGIGCLSGLVAGLTGTGGGVINMPLFLSVLNMPIHNAVATSTFVILPSSIAATLQHVAAGTVNYRVAIPFATGSMAGAVVGPRIALSLKPQKLRLIIGVIILVAGIKMIMSLA